MHIETFRPESLGKALGEYSLVARVRATETIYVSGMIATDENGAIVGKNDMARQCQRVFERLDIALTAAGAHLTNIVQLTSYLADEKDIPAFMSFRKREFPRLFASGVYPTSTLIVARRLFHPDVLIAVQATAAV
jgi:enamine deaminase RidA (YjgF/YER057c/UK114 family)